MSFEIGKLQSEAGRDAIHVPVISVFCSDSVKGGDKVRFIDDSYTQVRIVGKDEEYHAIVDPFLPYKKRCPNMQVLVFLKPGTVTKLSHHFEPNMVDVPKAYVEPEVDDDDDDNSCSGCY